MSRRRKILLGALVAVLLVAAGAGVAWWAVHRPVADIHNGASLPFTLSEPTTTDITSTTPTEPRWGPPWPFYGRDRARTRDASEMTDVHPPYRVVWKSRSLGFLEFPPSYMDGVLYEGSDAGIVAAINAKTGDIIWRRHFGSVPNQPAVWDGKVYFATFDNPGSIYALGAKGGRTLWRTKLTDQIESSMVVSDGLVFTGGQDGIVRALNAETGHVVWKFQASGAVKDSIAVSQGRAYFGSYGGVMYCVRANDGKLVWSTGTHGLSGGLRSGTFYASPAVAYGRVYISNTDGKVYSFVASTGQIAWTSTMPDWAYGSPGIANGRVFASSYDGSVAAMNARTGARIWTHKLPYRTLGSSTIVGSLVYVSDLGAKGQHGHVYAMDVATGRIVWRFPDGKYHSVIVANGHLILAGVTNLYNLRPRVSG
jgi:outer membrane protein assembly factor BamB